MGASKLDIMIENLAGKPSNDFWMKRKLIAQCQSELSENNWSTHTLHNKVKIEIYNIISKIPQLIKKYVNTHPSFSVINAIKDIQILLTPYLDYFVGDDVRICEDRNTALSKNGLYRALRHYLQVVHNNRQTYKEYKKKPRELLQFLRPDIKVDTPHSHPLEVIFCDGIIVFLMPETLMDQLNLGDEGTLMGQQSEHYTKEWIREWWSIGRHLSIIIRKKTYNEDLFLRQIFGKPWTLEHELQHVYNAFYMEHESCYTGIQSELYSKAKNEIIAQFKNNESIWTVLYQMKGKGYDYIGQKKEYRTKSLPREIKKREERMQVLENMKAPDLIMKNEKSTLAWEMSDIEMLSNPEKLDAFRKHYYSHLRKHIHHAGAFIAWSLDTKKIQDPYMILAITPIDQWDTLLELIE